MVDAGIQKGARRRIVSGRRSLLQRRVALLGGTTTWSDCLVALRHLLNPQALIHGSAIQEYEDAFARRVGARYAYSFSSGRVGL